MYVIILKRKINLKIIFQQILRNINAFFILHAKHAKRNLIWKK